MKKKTLLSSILVIALCLCLIAGSTFALFTSEDSVNIVVDAGHVEIEASLTEPILYSVQPDPNGAEFDENGKPYTYYEQNGSFANGGTATLNQTTGEIELENITPGDKIVFNLNGTNNSDVKVQYRYKLECIAGYDLMKGFVVTVDGTKYASMAAYTSAWEPLAKGENIMVDTVDGGVEFALELPVSAGNEFQDLSATIKLTVEAIQDNADISDTDKIAVQYITSAANATELAAKLASDEYLHIFIDEDIDQKVVVNFDMAGKTIDANGHDVPLQFGTGDTARITLENVVVKNLATSGITVSSGVSGDLTILDSNFVGSGNYTVTGGGDQDRLDMLDMTFENCTFDGSRNPIRFYHLANLTIRKCTFKNTGSWAILINGSNSVFVRGNIVVTDSTFENCTGILKAAVGGGLGTGSLSGNFTFANNKMNNCGLKNDVYMDIQEIEGLLTFSNNTMNDVVVTPEDMLGIAGYTNP